MAIATATAVLLQASGLLNDAAQTSFTNTVLLPYLKIAFDEMQIALDGYQTPFVNKAAAPVTVAAAATTMTAPTDMVRPTNLWERLQGSTLPEDYVEMHELNWDPKITPVREKNFWAWVGNAFLFPASTSDRQILLEYVATLTDPAIPGNDSVQLQRVHVFLQYRVAGLAARFVMQDTIRADGLDTDAFKALDAILRAAVRSNQSKPAKRMPFRHAWNQRIRRRVF